MWSTRVCLIGMIQSTCQSTHSARWSWVMWQSSPDTWGPCWSKGSGGTQPCVLEGGGNGNAPAYTCIHIPGIEDTCC